MRRIRDLLHLVRLGLFALGLPATALGTSYQCCSPLMPLHLGTWEAASPTGPIRLTFTGIDTFSGMEITLIVDFTSLGSVSPRPPGCELFVLCSMVKTGTVTIMSNGSTITHRFNGGTLSAGPFKSAATTFLFPGSTLPPNGFIGGLWDVDPTTPFGFPGTGKLNFANLTVTAPVPEPTTLDLLGTGLIGLAEIARRKLKLGT